IRKMICCLGGGGESMALQPASVMRKVAATYRRVVDMHIQIPQAPRFGQDVLPHHRIDDAEEARFTWAVRTTFRSLSPATSRRDAGGATCTQCYRAGSKNVGSRSLRSAYANRRPMPSAYCSAALV